MDNDNSDTQTKFNAGLDIAITISQILKNCEYFARSQRFDNWYNELQILQRRLYSKAIKSVGVLEEIEEASKDKNNILSKYQVAVARKRKITASHLNQLYWFLSNYEKTLRKYVDVFGYGMPESESFESVIMR